MPILLSGRSGSSHSSAAEEEVVLLDRIAAEDMRAFETLYRLYHPRLLRFIDGMLRQRALVEEVLDGTMMAVWRKAHTYNHSAKVFTRIFAIAYRQVLKALKRQESPPVLETPEDSGAGPERPCQQQELQQLMQAMESLSADHRAVIELTYYLGMRGSHAAWPMIGAGRAAWMTHVLPDTITTLIPSYMSALPGAISRAGCITRRTISVRVCRWCIPNSMAHG